MISNDKTKQVQQLLAKMEASILKQSCASAKSFTPITNAVDLFNRRYEIDDLDGAFAALGFRQQRKFNAMRARANGYGY